MNTPNESMHDEPRKQRTTSEERASVRDYRSGGFALRGIAYFVAGLLVFLVGALALMGGLFSFFDGGEPAIAPEDRSPFADTRVRRPAPQTNIALPDSMIRMTQRADSVLSTYGPSTAVAGAVRIPIEQAFDVMLDGDGFPTRATPGVPSRGRFTESGFRLGRDTLRSPLALAYDTTENATSAQVNVPGHGIGRTQPRVRAPMGTGMPRPAPAASEEPK